MQYKKNHGGYAFTFFLMQPENNFLLKSFLVDHCFNISNKMMISIIKMIFNERNYLDYILICLCDHPLSVIIGG